ncbi:TPA: IgG-binding virulence factor TspB family protein [Neisseria cinerea]
MNSFIKSTPIVLILILCSSSSYSEPLKLEESEIRFHYSNNLKSNGFKLDSKHERFAKFAEAANVEHIPTGAKARISAKITASVSRAGVLAGVGALVRQGAKLGTRAVPYVGTALLAYDIYKELNPELEKAGFRYSEDIGDYVKYYENALCKGRFRSEPGYFSCVGVDSSELLALSQGGQRAKETQDLLVRRVQSDLERIADVLGKDYGEPNRFKTIDYCFYNGDISVSCSFGDLLLRYELQHEIKKSEPNPNSFNDLIAKKVDANPDRFIKATNFPGYKEDVEVAPGTKLNIGPVTDKSGNPVQVLVSFGRDSQGKTTADVQVTPRPDLTPGSAEAPNVRPSPDTSPATNPSNNPNPNEQPGTSPSPEPDPDTNPEPNVQPGTSPGSPVLPGTSPANGRDGKDGGLLCRFFPNILACDQIPEPSADSDPQLPNETVNVEFEKSGIFQDSAQCPAPVTFTITVLESSKQFAFSFENACTIAERLRYMLLALAWAVAAFFCIRTVSREV